MYSSLNFALNADIKVKNKIFSEILVEARVLMGLGQHQKVITLIQAKLEHFQCSFDMLLILAEAHMKNGSEGVVKNIFNKHIECGNVLSIHWMQIIDFYFDRKLYEDSLFYINIAMKSAPFNGRIISRKAEIYFLKNMVDEAAESLLKKINYAKLQESDVGLIKKIRYLYSSSQKDSEVKFRFLSQPEIIDVLRRQVFQRSVSLGIDCEFGFVQRLMGEEPLSLFRWGTLPLEKLIDLLNSRFEMFASEKLCYLELSNTPDHYEYWFHDKQYQLKAHTFYNPKNTNIMESDHSLLLKIRKHFLFLARKLEEDLEDAQKLFVYKSNNVLDLNQINALISAISQYGDAMLLVVMPRSADLPPFEIISRSLVIGRINKYWDGASLHSIDINAWSEILNFTWNFFIDQHPEMKIL